MKIWIHIINILICTNTTYGMLQELATSQKNLKKHVQAEEFVRVTYHRTFKNILHRTSLTITSPNIPVAIKTYKPESPVQPNTSSACCTDTLRTLFPQEEVKKETIQMTVIAHHLLTEKIGAILSCASTEQDDEDADEDECLIIKKQKATVKTKDGISCTFMASNTQAVEAIKILMKQKIDAPFHYRRVYTNTKKINRQTIEFAENTRSKSIQKIEFRVPQHVAIAVKSNKNIKLTTKFGKITAYSKDGIEQFYVTDESTTYYDPPTIVLTAKNGKIQVNGSERCILN